MLNMKVQGQCQGRPLLLKAERAAPRQALESRRRPFLHGPKIAANTCTLLRRVVGQNPTHQTRHLFERILASGPTAFLYSIISSSTRRSVVSSGFSRLECDTWLVTSSS